MNIDILDYFWKIKSSVIRHFLVYNIEYKIVIVRDGRFLSVTFFVYIYGILYKVRFCPDDVKNKCWIYVMVIYA